MKIFQFAWTSAILFLVFYPIAQAGPIGHTLLAENEFSGRVSQVIIEDWAKDWVKNGDVVAGTRFHGDFALYDTGEESGYGEMFLQSNYTFFGIEDTYVFSIEAGLSNVWGFLEVDSDRSLAVSWKNNFISDGLEQTFHDDGHDTGYFDIVFENHMTPAVRGSGSFGWEGITVEFGFGRATVVAEPSSLLLLIGGLFTLVAARRRR
ncbi:PEP-CTERM sorting domain-containing protein [Marinobacter zhanjiangensis]|uniref:PEP-CTERM protein-sorting domain-containing protein n=1 Tax=Marinobacter zhanjiangensis TaxID=578215 RepID=A0ABQ3B748_9GAMM|nr:PEP-CTERM sorting domain-containing protein [Marinobacter zhanjiangensis]GGY80254.1 hypothetical protein GCM10007071_29470 [Marinobacter zhanjiangensis]